jgi:hypothetical protein
LSVIGVKSRFKVPVNVQRTLLTIAICSVLIVVAGGIVRAQTPGDEIWQQSTESASFLSRYSHSSVVFNNGNGDEMWVAGGNSVSSGLFNDVWRSRDGVTWTSAVNSAQFPARADHTSVTFQKKMWVIGGYGGARTFNDVWQSTDGVTWKEVTASAAFPVRYGHTSVVFDDKLWVIGGSGDSGNYYNDVWYSSDGATWQLATDSAPFPPRYSHTSLIFDNKIWVIGGYSAQSGNLNDVWYSSDGISWEEANASASWPARGDHTSLVFDHRMWVMGGSGDSGNFQDIWYSSDGVLWTRAGGVTLFPARTCHSSVIFEKKAWVIAGWGDSGNLNDVWFTTIPVLPEVTAISPVSAPNISTTSLIDIEGSNFITGATVILNRTGVPDIRGTDVTILSPTRITCRFDLTGRPPGQYTVMVRNPDGQQGTLQRGFTIISADADQIVNTTINGLTFSTCKKPQNVSVDTSILPSVLQQDGTALELQPPPGSGLKKIVLNALKGTRFTRTTNNTLTGTADSVYLETVDIVANGSQGPGSPFLFRYSMDLASYPCNGLLRTTLWKGALPEDRENFLRTAQRDGARYYDTAYTATITRSNFPLPDSMILRVGLNASSVPLADETSRILVIEGISDDRKTGKILRTNPAGHDPGANLDYFNAESPGSLTIFGISFLSDTNISYQMIPLGNTGGNDPSGTYTGNPAAVPQETFGSTITKDQGQTADLTIDTTGMITESVTLQSTDCLARVNIGKGTQVKQSDGTPLASVMIRGIANDSLPSLPPGSPSSFAERAYEFLPDGAVFTPEIPVSFIAPHVQSGNQFQVKTLNQASGAWQDIPTRYDTGTATVTAQVSHFCIIALFSQPGGTNPDTLSSDLIIPQDSLSASQSQNTGISYPAILSGIGTRILDNIFLILGILILTGTIFLRTRKPRRYRVLYEK